MLNFVGVGTQRSHGTFAIGSARLGMVIYWWHIGIAVTFDRGDESWTWQVGW